MQRLPKGWKSILTSSSPAGGIILDKVVSASRNGSVFTCIRRGPDLYTEWRTKPPAPETTAENEWLEIQSYARSRLEGIWKDHE